MKAYTSRKEQLAAFVRDFVRDWPSLLPRQRRQLAKLLRDAAMVGAAEERSRTLGILRQFEVNRRVAEEIMDLGVLAVLGYEERPARPVRP